ncbi:hypothetical protein LH500_01775 [Lentilactobacillus hilgardii]|uniref:Uncharacterized protein n=1 Tax=Lentilactobacillus hilgardii (strain ATCC 8290 / DSM 20176 / CCUG 30140 / JCM 1155 / KCTC 3500 / NBRC 15886 / NCIMB 8040 / NRRL B-1843 / 9) TaxID=1423757 RepID=C0XJK3_LENH9|nr:hypothetical protein HMPREF0519_1414 [Lentilactobacillus hilgardii DSM 20176 = ATCC 8290]KRK53806.1 hypothetical protein FD42_GL001570 [Lentilactobacillus hilgardii DSM 20176 = ATCC 8290]QEU39730.1 hypothetical protein LH500_01775 [Lentilactobacillus hilgardii]
MGISFTKYLNRFRISKTRQLLKNTGEPITAKQIEQQRVEKSSRKITFPDNIKAVKNLKLKHRLAIFFCRGDVFV